MGASLLAVAKSIYYSIQLSPKGEVNRGNYIPRREASRYIYLTLFTNPQGHSCFSIYQIRWIKTQKVTFWKLKTSLSRNFVYNLRTFRSKLDFV